MILFFGTRTGKKVIRELEGIQCPYCQQVGTLNGVTQPNYIHLFWLPILKMGTFQHVECSHCKKVYAKNDFTQSMKKTLGTD